MSSSSSSFPSVLPQHCLNAPVLYELLKGEEERSRMWLRAEMNQIADPLIDSLFSGLIMSSSSSAVPQSRLTVPELCQQLDGEKVEVRRVLRGEMDRLTNSLFERLTNKLKTNLDLDRYQLEDGGGDDDRARLVNQVDQVESPNTQSYQPASLFFQPSTSSLNPVAHQQHSNGDELELNTAEIIEIKEEVEDGEETRVIDIEALTEHNQSGGGKCPTGDTTQQIDCVKQEIKEEFDSEEEIEIKQEEEDETTNKEVKLEIKEEEEEGGVDESLVNDIDEVPEDNQNGVDESRSVENSPMDTTPAHPIGQSQVNIRQSGRVEKRKKTDQEPQVQNEGNDQEDNEGGDDEEVTPLAAKRPRPTRPTTSSSTQEKQIITHTLQCPKVDCLKMVAQDQFNKHLWEKHSIHPLRCPVKDCKRSFDNKTNVGQHLSQCHQSNSQWNCDKCDHHFTAYNLLSNHHSLHHQIGHFQCSFASCTFTGEYREKVYNHYKQQHKQRFDCPQSGCPFTAPNASKLRLHQRGHAGIKPYRCKWSGCDYSATQRSDTIKHIREKHLKRNPRPSGTQLADPKDFLEVVGELF